MSPAIPGYWQPYPCFRFPPPHEVFNTRLVCETAPYGQLEMILACSLSASFPCAGSFFVFLF